MNKNKIAIVIYFILMASCTSKTPLESVFKQDFIEAIENYIRKDTSSHISYLILPVEGLPYNGTKPPKGFLVGPLYRNIDSANIVRLMSYHGKTVYIYSKNREFFKSPSAESSISYCSPDSCIAYDNVYTIDPGINYMKGAALLYYENEKLHIKNDIGPLFLPKLISQDVPE